MLAAAVALLVVIGGIEATVSARELVELRGAVRLQPGGTVASVLGMLASALVYVAIGAWTAEDQGAVRRGLVVGALAGAIGGAVRAWIIADDVREIASRYATLSDWFIPTVLAVFVAGATLAIAAVGAALAFLGVRVRRASR